MRLHEDIDAFAELVQTTAETVGLPQVYVEKDYWVTKALKHLSKSIYVNDVVFKGGTSLSKAYRLIERFSEDIDLAVFAEGKGDSARKSLLKNVEAIVATGLFEVEDDPRVSKGSKYRKTVHRYPLSFTDAGFGQASPELLIELNSFTHPEPFEIQPIQSLIAESLTTLGETDLITQFALESFSIKVLSVKRTLTEKMLGIIKDSYDKNPVARLSDRIRHLYDICLILRHREYRDFVQSDHFMALCTLCLADETAEPESSNWRDKPLADAPIFTHFETWQASLNVAYQGMFSDLVFGEIPDISEIAQGLKFLQEHISRVKKSSLASSRQPS